MSTARRRVPELPLVHTWRVATAARVFVLALLLGQVIAAGELSRSWPTVLGLMALATCCSVAELAPMTPRLVVPLAEAAVASVLIASAAGPAGPVSAYLVVPVLAAGVRLGARCVPAVAIVSLVALVGSALLGLLLPGVFQDATHVGAGLPWLATGTGGGLLAAAQTRSARRAAAEQAPYDAAHRLVADLHSLVDRRALDLDVASTAEALLATLERHGVQRGSVWRRGDDGEPELLAATGPATTDGDRARAAGCLTAGRAAVGPGRVVLPLRVGEHVTGVLVGALPALAVPPAEDLQEEADELAVRLDTALLVERIQGMATSEERNRLARDLHDGVAQRLVALGLRIEDLIEPHREEDGDALIQDLRSEVTRIVQELRFSLFDLRHEHGDDDNLSATLSEYAHELSRGGQLRVHLSLDERGERLPRRTEGELVNIAREAITNVHRHAGAINLWVSLFSDGRRVRLTVEDDGVGAASAKPGHYGLQCMRERAERIGAHLAVASRPDGGTIVTVTSRSVAAGGRLVLRQPGADLTPWRQS